MAKFEYALFEHYVVGGGAVEDFLKVYDVGVAYVSHDGEFLRHISDFGALLVGHLNSIKFAILAARSSMHYRESASARTNS